MDAKGSKYCPVWPGKTEEWPTPALGFVEGEWWASRQVFWCCSHTSPDAFRLSEPAGVDWAPRSNLVQLVVPGCMDPLPRALGHSCKLFFCFSFLLFLSSFSVYISLWWWSPLKHVLRVFFLICHLVWMSVWVGHSYSFIHHFIFHQSLVLISHHCHHHIVFIINSGKKLCCRWYDP